MAAQSSLRHEARRTRPRQHFWERAQPSQPFRIVRRRRGGFLPEEASSHKGQVYVASCDGLETGVFKIGKSTDFFSKRSQALSQPTGAPGFYFPVYRLESDVFDELEKKALERLEAFRLHKRKEFVACSLDEIIKTLQHLQHEAAPSEAFSEHFYFPIEEFEAELLCLYDGFLLRPGPEQWPRICLFLSLSSGLSPREIFVALQDGSATPAAGLVSDFPPRSPHRWLAEYLLSLMRYERLPYGQELGWLWPCCLCPGEGCEVEELSELCERWDWYFRQWEDELWAGVESIGLLRKIHAAVTSESPTQLCASIHQKVWEYKQGRGVDASAFSNRGRRSRDFHFI